MPFFKDIGKAAGDLLGDDHFFFNKKVKVETKASNGSKFTFNKDMSDGGSSDGAVAYKHSSGINLKKLQVTNGGKVNVEAEVAEAVCKGSKLYMKITTLPEACNKYVKKKLVQETGTLGLKYDDKTYAVDASVNVLCADAPALAASVVATGLGMDGLSVGADMSYKTSLDTLGEGNPSAGGKLGSAAKGLQVDGATPMSKIPYKLNVQYAVPKDFSLAAVFTGQKNTLDIKYHQVLASECEVAATVGLNLADKAAKPTLQVGGSYQLDKDTTVYGKFSSCSNEVALAVSQALNANVQLNMATAISMSDMKSQKFGCGLEFSN